MEIPYKSKVTRLFCHYLLQAVDGQHHNLINQITCEQMYIAVVKKKSVSLIALSSLLREVLATGKYTEKIEMKRLLNLQRDLQDKTRTLPILYLLQYEASALSIYTYYSLNIVILHLNY